MQILQVPQLCTLPKPLKPQHPHQRRTFLPFPHSSSRYVSSRCYASDEFPVDESFLESFGPKDQETEDEARRRNWVERGWAPWEEILTPEADFARKSLNEGEEVPLQTPEAIESFRMLKPSYRRQKMTELGLTEDEWYRKQFEIKGEIPEPLQTVWAGPWVATLMPPRDWPPRGWEVDRGELEFIRETHKLQAKRVSLEDLESQARDEGDDGLCLDRYKLFLKQYYDWVAANRDRLEVESYKVINSFFPLSCFFS